MNRKVSFAAIVAAAGLAAPAVAQDSVSANPGTFVGDALVPWQVQSQCADFIVTLSPIETSRGVTFGVAPLLKSSKVETAFFSSLIGPQTVSSNEIVVPSFAADAYNFWNFPGGGVNFFGDPAPNQMGQLITPMADGDIYQFAAGFSEFATTDSGGDYEGIIGGVVNYDKANPQRLFVSRFVAATDRAMGMGPDAAEFGFGTVDASGNMYFRADDFGPTAPDSITGNNIFRVSLLGRDCDTVNRISNAGGADAAATDWLVVNSNKTFSVPGNIPATVAGRPVYVGLTFDTEFAAETTPGSVTLDTTFLGGLATDVRGVVATYKDDVLNNGGVAIGGNLSKSSGGPTDSISLYSLDSNGNVIGGSQRIITLPGASITDPVEGFTLSNNGEYDNYRSQAPFRGGNSQVGLGVDAAGNLLAAGTTYLSVGGNQDPFNAIPVARLNPSTGAIEYSLAAWIDFDPAGPAGVSGKPVLDAAGNRIGELRPFIELDPGRPGPSLSSPGIDGAGNVWFVGLVAFDDPNGGAPFFRTTLLRAVYQADVNGGFGYELEKVLAFGDIIEGQNTGLNYRVGGFQITDANSINSSTLWSSNVKQCTWGGINPADIDPADPRSTAGVVIATSITYDVDQDGDFNLNQMDDPNTIDEAYNVLLYVSNIQKDAGPACPQDLNNDGEVDAGDLAALIAQWGQMGASADFGGDGVGADDLASLLAAWGPCPQ